MPSAGVSAAVLAAAPSCTLASTCTVCPSAVAPGPDQFAAAAAAARAASTWAVAAATSGSSSTVPRIPSISTNRPASTSSRPVIATTHGIPS